MTTCETCGSHTPHITLGYPICPDPFHGHMNEPLWDTTNLVRGALIIVAAVLTVYATASLLTGFETDFTVSAILALCALGGVFLVDHLEAAHDRRITQCREETYTRWDEEAGL